MSLIEDEITTLGIMATTQEEIGNTEGCKEYQEMAQMLLMLKRQKEGFELCKDCSHKDLCYFKPSYVLKGKVIHCGSYRKVMENAVQ